MTGNHGYELIDAGDGRRLERFGAVVVDRLAGTATPGPACDPAAWPLADGRFDVEDGWSWRIEAPTDWSVDVDGLELALRPGVRGQVGLFPEQVAACRWLASAIQGLPGTPAVLNLFASTGLATLFAARAGASVTHVDAMRSAVAWARENAERSGLEAAPIRWLVDDCLAFVRREARRGRRYHAVVLDPPSYGHGPSSRAWELTRDLPELLDACRMVLSDDPIVLLTAHSHGLVAGDLGLMLDAVVDGPIEAGDLTVAATSGVTLGLGVYARRRPDPGQ